MASESTEEESLQVHLPADLGNWLEDRARELDVERDRLLVELLAAYRATAEADRGGDAGSLEVSLGDDAVQEEVIASVVDDRVEAAVEDALTDRLQPRPAALDERLSALEADLDTMIEDVRDRIIQVKREADTKAPADHSHEGLDRIETVAERVEALETDLAALATEGADERDALADDLDTLEERVEEIGDRLKTVAWVVTDLREAAEERDGIDAVDRIKRAAGELDVDRAKCEHCGEGVEIALLTDPTCPHCEATVTDVEAARGFFGKPKLLVASQLESGG